MPKADTAHTTSRRNIFASATLSNVIPFRRRLMPAPAAPSTSDTQKRALLMQLMSDINAALDARNAMGRA